MTDSSLSKSYRKFDTHRTMEEDAREAFRQIIPHIQERYPSIRFNTLDNSRRGDGGEYFICGAYEGRGFFGIKRERSIVLKWESCDWGKEGFQLFSPIIQFNDPWGYEFTNFESLGELLNRELKVA